jgi:hypothetical protein
MIATDVLAAALIARCHGQVVLTTDELYEAERLVLKVVANERNELVVTATEHAPKQER